MKTIHLTYPIPDKNDDFPETVAAIGFFDGIHQGHQKVINTALDLASKQNRESAVITFHPHPSVVLRRGQQQVNYLTPLSEKQEILKGMGIERMYVITFNEELSRLEPQDFADHFLIGLNIKHLVSGFDFSYGYKGKGSVDTIEEHSRGSFSFTAVEKVEMDHHKVSSTLIRDCLRNGDIEKANELLGRPFAAHGVVIEGEKRGRTIGFPTANLELPEELLMPKIGVYAVTIRYEGQTLKGMANIGYKPTFHEDVSKPSVEVHIFDYKKQLYGQELVMEWHAFVREEKKFNGIEELIAQLQEDEQEIRSILKEI
ncbi:bifunctional riboflavin kinase/FAD synthetase [Sediminibacillus massiliensis]|uniref:bifunctional riboflavin kinase/FAD synthetase n=1 Tax=Sediminibacillus massiliensis TaxID=1926277 RepID=UPI0009888F0A|nr:bifunctional riboflavin kinase/FAD synthetase [Sediminibacillus massiliensis]